MMNSFKRELIAYILGIAVMFSLSAAVILLLPIFILNEYFSEEYTRVVMIISMTILAFLGTYIAGKISAEPRCLRLAAVVLVYFIPVFCLSIFVFGGFSLCNLYNIAAGGSGGMLAAFMLTKRKKPHTKRKKQKGYR